VSDIRGRQIVLRPATLRDRRRVFEWLTRSDVTAAMLGPPLYPDAPVPTWEEFCGDYQPHYFDGSTPMLGRSYLILAGADPVGHINYNDIFEKDGQRRVELDVWMRSRAWCGKGYGPDAIETLCRHLLETYGVTAFMVQPSARNPAAIRAYEKAGFHRLHATPQAAEAMWGPWDYEDSVFMVRQAR
jgi:RimJ/RimL family protein N-acetyltransferase